MRFSFNSCLNTPQVVSLFYHLKKLLSEKIQNILVSQ